MESYNSYILKDGGIDNIQITYTADAGCPKDPVSSSYNETLTFNQTAPLQGSYEPVVTHHVKHDPHKGGSWSKVKKSGSIKMTPYSNRKTTGRNWLSSIEINQYRGFPGGQGSRCTKNGVELIDASGAYHILTASATAQRDYHGWKSRYASSPHFGADVSGLEDDLKNQIESLKSQVVSDNLKDYDFGEEFAERRETFNELISLLRRARSPLQEFKKAKKVILNSKKKPAELQKALSDLWMEYRYGISPIIYSIQDINNLLKDRHSTYKTSRAYRKIDVSRYSASENFDPSQSFFHERLNGHIEIRGLGKARFSSSGRRLSSQIGFNPISTLWAITPYSFVVDWFANVGDFLTANLGSLVDFSEERKFCYSVKRSYSRDIYLHIPEAIQKLTYRGWDPFGKGYVIEPVDLNLTCNDETTLHVWSTAYDWYDRTLFQPENVKLIFDPYLDWKRLADSLSLSSRSVSNALRRLK